MLKNSENVELIKKKKVTSGIEENQNQTHTRMELGYLPDWQGRRDYTVNKVGKNKVIHIERKKGVSLTHSIHKIPL